MRSIKFNLSKKSESSWDLAVLLAEAYLSTGRKSNQLLDELPADCKSEVRARAQSLFLGALRHGHSTLDATRPFLRKEPRDRIQAIILVTGYELLIESAELSPKIVHHAVERSKGLIPKHEQRFLNALLRKLKPSLDALKKTEDLAIKYSHPLWLVDHWKQCFGHKATEALLNWNQQIPDIYAKVSNHVNKRPQCLIPTDWDQFYRIDSKSDWQKQLAPLLIEGHAYIKDPSTRLAPALLNAQPDDDVLDLCAAPGGKAFEMATSMKGQGLIVAVDLPSERIKRLEQNLDRIETESLKTKIVEADLTEISKSTFETENLPTQYDAVMLDAPCSNTGVIQRRTDVKWRLKEDDISNCAKLQQQLIHSATRFVKPGGRFVYSTCSIEPSENRELIDDFLSSKSGKSFTLIDQEIALPWERGHDGASAFLLIRLRDRS